MYVVITIFNNKIDIYILTFRINFSQEICTCLFNSYVSRIAKFDRFLVYVLVMYRVYSCDEKFQNCNFKVIISPFRLLWPLYAMFLFFMYVDDKGNVNPRRLIIKHDLLAITGPHNISYPTKPSKLCHLV